MSTIEIIIHEDDGSLSSQGALVMPSRVHFPPEDPRSLLYLLDGELQRLALEEELERRAEEEERALQREAAARQEQEIAVAALQEMLENDFLIDALGRRTLAIAGFDMPNVFYDPYYHYPTKAQSTSYTRVFSHGGFQEVTVIEPSIHHQELPSLSSFAPTFSSNRLGRRLPALYAHEPEPDHVRASYDDRELNWLAQELLNSRRASSSSQQGDVALHGRDDGSVFILDDGSVGDSLSSRAASVPPSDVAPPAEPPSAYATGLPILQDYHVDEFPGEATPTTTTAAQTLPASEESDSADAHDAEAAAPPTSQKVRAPTVMDEEEEVRLETEGVPVTDAADARPRKTMKVGN